MKPKDRDFVFYLTDIADSIKKIIACTEGLSGFDELESDWMKYDAVLRNLEIIGEAANRIPLPVKQLFPTIPWEDMYRTRNIIIHHYFGIDPEIIWQITTTHLPENLTQIQCAIDLYQT